MLRENQSIILEIQKFLDAGISAFSFIAAYFIKRNLMPSDYRNLSTDPNYYIILLLIIISWYIAFKWTGMYMSYRTQPFWMFFVAILKSCFLGMIIVSIAMYVMHIQGVSRLLMGIFLLLDVGLLTLSKFIVFKTLKRLRTDGFNIRNVLIVGSENRARQVIEAVEAQKATGYRILGLFEADPQKIGKPVSPFSSPTLRE